MIEAYKERIGAGIIDTHKVLSARGLYRKETVRELNEGVKKIFSDMINAGLPAPEYIETPNDS